MINDVRMNWDETMKSKKYNEDNFLGNKKKKKKNFLSQQGNFLIQFSISYTRTHTTSSDFFIERIGQVSSTLVPHVACMIVVDVVVEPFAIQIEQE